jgi:adenine-specific DNA-methyltransferase
MEEHKVDNSFTQYKNRIGLTDGKRFIKDTNDVVLDFPYKDCVLEGGQSTEEGIDNYYEYSEKDSKYEEKQAKRKEIFFNQILAKDEIDRLFDEKALVNWKRFTKDGEQEVNEIKRDDNGIIRENMIIKGNNLLALHSLKKQFSGKVKLIYIDPPYNTGNDDFKYNDNFTHSTWLTFMKNRLEIAKDLLSDDGSIFIQINDIEQAYLKVLCDSIFKRENFHTNICIQMSHLSGVKMAHKDKKLPKIKEFILFYTKSPRIKLNPQHVPASWEEALERYTSFVKKYNYSDTECNKWDIVTLKQAMKEAGINSKDKKAIDCFKIDHADSIFRTARNRGADYSNLDPTHFNLIKNPDNSYYFVYKGEDVNFAADKIISINNKMTPVIPLGDIWTDIGINNLSNEGGVDLRFGKKPEKILERIIKLISKSDDDVIMDFFSGSGTTGAVAHKLNKKYILIEQLDTHINKTIKRLSNVIAGENNGISKTNNWQGGGDFIYFELAKWNEKAKEEILACNRLEDLKTLFDNLYDKYFLNYNLKIKEFKEKVIEEDKFKNLPLDEQKKMFLTMLDLNQMYVQKSEMADKRFGISKKDQDLTNNFYNSDRD